MDVVRAELWVELAHASRVTKVPHFWLKPRGHMRTWRAAPPLASYC